MAQQSQGGSGKPNFKPNGSKGTHKNAQQKQHDSRGKNGKKDAARKGSR